LAAPGGRRPQWKYFRRRVGCVEWGRCAEPAEDGGAGARRGWVIDILLSVLAQGTTEESDYDFSTRTATFTLISISAYLLDLSLSYGSDPLTPHHLPYNHHHPQLTMSTVPARFWGQPIRYLRWASHEKPAIFWSVILGIVRSPATATLSW
jgi:hypothetical protein